MKKKLAVAAVFVCIGAGVVGTGVAHAAVYVVSDKITLTAKLVPFIGEPGYTFTSSTCSLTSDGEPGVFKCNGSGIGSLKSLGASQDSLNFKTSSADGSISTVTLPETQISATADTFKGKVTEKDAKEGGVVPPPYAAVVSGTEKIVGLSITITATVSELSTQP